MPVAAFLALTLVVSAATIDWLVNSAARRTDEVAAEHEERLAANGLAVSGATMRHTVMTETIWDDAVDHLDRRFDRTWAEANIITFFRDTAKYELVAVLDGSDHPLISYMHGGTAEALLLKPPADLQRMVDSVRAREARLQRRQREIPSSSLVSEPVDATSVVEIGGAPYLLTAALVQSDFGKSSPSKHAPIVVVGEAFNHEFLQQFGRAYLLSNLRLLQSPPSDMGLSALTLRSDAGKSVAWIAWTPDSPARDLVRHLRTPLSVLGALLTLLPMSLLVLERRRARQLRLARDDAESASLAKSEFLANMSHEIRTPLNGVMGVAGALGRTPLSPPQAEMVSLIETSAKTLETLLSDILDLARVEAGKLELRPEPFDLAASVNACAALFDAAAQAKGLDLEVVIAPHALGTYLGDAARIRQILSNLLGNAVKFTQAGNVRLTVDASTGETASELRFEVKDTGIGFDEACKARLFSRFEQADGSITRQFGGSGLGLAISRSLAEAMGGRLEANATPGAGAVFSLTVELAHCIGTLDPWREEPEEEAEQDPLLGMRVLLAEDHPTNRRVVELILGAAGVDLTCVENGADAVDAFRSGVFDLILMDMQMPVMDGLTAIASIRALEREAGGPATPTFVLTANAMPEHVTASLQAGADGHLSKPIVADALLNCVSAAAIAARGRRRAAA